MIFIAIVEDEEIEREKIKEYINRFSKENGENINVSLFTDGDEIVDNYKSNYDIIFLDIQMKRLNGLNAAAYIRKFDDDVILIFITNMSQYAIKGYSVNALDFLLKPVPYFAFAEKLKKCIDIISRKRAVNILVTTENGIAKIDTNSIIYIESFGHKIIIHTNKGVNYSVFSSMKNFEKKLTNNFFRIGSSYIINLAYVAGIKGAEVNINNLYLPISRKRKKEFLDALAIYVGDGV